MKTSDINPHIRYAAIHYTFLSKSLDSICYDCRFFYIEEGTGTIRADGQSYPFSVNTAIFLPPGTKYHIYQNRNSHKFTMTVVNFDLVNDYSLISNSLGTANEQNFLPEKLISYDLPEVFSSIIVKPSPGLTEILHKCTEEFSSRNSFYRESASALLKLCLMDFQRHHHRDQIVQKVTPIINFIHSNYHDPNLSYEMLANAFNYTPNHLSTIIKGYTGKSLYQYLISYRIKMAKENLITTDDPIHIIAWKSGFQSTSNFISTFKRQTGMTPKHYRDALTQFYF